MKRGHRTPATATDDTAAAPADPPAWETFGAGTGNPDDHLHNGVIAPNHADGRFPHWHEDPDQRYVPWTTHPDWSQQLLARRTSEGNGQVDPQAATRVNRLDDIHRPQSPNDEDAPPRPIVSPLATAGSQWWTRGDTDPEEESPMPDPAPSQPYEPPTVTGPHHLHPAAAAEQAEVEESQQRHPAGRDLAVPTDQQRADLKAAGAAEVGKAILSFALPAAQEEYALRVADAQQQAFEAARLLGRITTILTIQRELADEDDLRGLYRVARSLLVTHGLDEE